MAKNEAAIYRGLFGEDPTAEELAEGILEKNPASRKSGRIMKLAPRGATAGGIRDFSKDAGGRPWNLDPPVLQNRTMYIDGFVYFDDLNDPTLVRLRELIEEAQSLAFPLREVLIDQFAPIYQRKDSDNRGRTTRVSERDFLQHLFDNPGSTTRGLAREIYGPFTNDHGSEDRAALSNAMAKVRVRLSELQKRGAVRKETSEDEPARWRALNPPDVEPRRGRYRLSWEGETLLSFKDPMQHEFASYLEAFAQPLGLTVRVVRNDGDQERSPEARRAVRRRRPHQARSDVLHALMTIDLIRRGQFSSPRNVPTLCHFSHWAKECYWRSDRPPTVDEQRYMESKAYKLLVPLVDLLQVVRRRDSSGKLILFVADDPEADNHDFF